MTFEKLHPKHILVRCLYHWSTSCSACHKNKTVSCFAHDRGCYSPPPQPHPIHTGEVSLSYSESFSPPQFLDEIPPSLPLSLEKSFLIFIFWCKLLLAVFSDESSLLHVERKNSSLVLSCFLSEGAHEEAVSHEGVVNTTPNSFCFS